jgi:hypothetical protein
MGFMNIIFSVFRWKRNVGTKNCKTISFSELAQEKPAAAG